MEDFNRKIELAKQQKKIEDDNLINSRNVSKKELDVYKYWFNYQAASTINWLVAKLKLIKSIIENGNPVTIQENPIKVLKTLDDLKVWIKNTFDQDIVNDVFE